MSWPVFLLEVLPFGVLIGALGRALSGERGRSGWALSMASSIAGALLGGVLGSLVPVRGEAPSGFSASLLGAFLLLAAHHAFLRPRLPVPRPVRP